MFIVLDYIKIMIWFILIDYVWLWGEWMKEVCMIYFKEKLIFYIYIFFGNNKKSNKNKIIIVVY